LLNGDVRADNAALGYLSSLAAHLATLFPTNGSTPQTVVE
jgi:hypothetical protein